MRGVDAVVFDVGGVLCESPLSELSRLGLPHGPLRNAIFGAGSPWESMERGELGADAFCAAAAGLARGGRRPDLDAPRFKQLLVAIARKGSTPRPEFRDSVRALKAQGLKVGILTNDFLVDVGLGTPELDAAALAGADAVVRSSRAGTRKPEAQAYREVARRLGVSPSRCVMVDDLQVNVDGALGAGYASAIRVGGRNAPAGAHLALLQLERATGVQGLLLARDPGPSSDRPSSSSSSPGLVIPAPAHRLDGVKLAAYLRAHVAGCSSLGPDVEVRQFGHGQSNPTYRVSGGGVVLVLRKKPPGALLKGAHQVEREFRVMQALEGSVPVPKMRHLCEGHGAASPVGTPFFLMDYVPGRIFTRPQLPGLNPTQRAAVYAAAVDALARLHAFDWRSTGLYKAPGKDAPSSSAHQTRIWTRQLHAALKVLGEAPSPQFVALGQALADGAPSPKDEGPPVLVHGDFRVDNLLFGDGETSSSSSLPRLAAVLDWELSGVGDPLSDLAYLCLPYRVPPEGAPGAIPGMPGLGSPLPDGVPAERELVAMYCAATGRRAPSEGEWGYRLALAFYRLGAILKGVHARAGNSSGGAETAARLGASANTLAALGLACIKSDGPGEEVGLEWMGARARKTLDKVRKFVRDECEPREEAVRAHSRGPNRWTVVPEIEELKHKAKSLGLWNLWIPLEADPEGVYGAGFTNAEYAVMAQAMGRVPWSSECFNCSAPDTGNMEVLLRYGTAAQKAKWLAPLLAGDIRSCFGMTEPGVASSDATNMRASVKVEGADLVVNGLKWWTSGAMDPRCKLCVFLGQAAGREEGPAHQRMSMVLVPMEAKGVDVLRPLTVYGYDDAPHGHAEVRFTDVRVPAVDGLLVGHGAGFQIAQGRLGPGRIHHCMRLLGMAERALELLCERAEARVAFGRPLAKNDAVLSVIGQSRVELDAVRALTLDAARAMDAHGNKIARKEIAAIKVLAPTVACDVIDRAVQIHGGAGVSDDTPLAHLWALARTLRLADGPDEVHRAMIAKLELARVRRNRPAHPSKL